jgi:hypothetical protein
MALLTYFKKKSVLPNPEGPLSKCMPPTAIVSANKEVKSIIVNEEEGACSSKSRGSYLSYTDEEKARIAKRAAEFGVINLVLFQ